MAVGAYLAAKSDGDQDTYTMRAPLMIGAVTLFSFMVIGFIPLLTYVIAAFMHSETSSLFTIAVILTMAGFLFI
jgi:hypothetical protein